jgi:hypothetical protein
VYAVLAAGDIVKVTTGFASTRACFRVCNPDKGIPSRNVHDLHDKQIFLAAFLSKIDSTRAAMLAIQNACSMAAAKRHQLVRALRFLEFLSPYL